MYTNGGGLPKTEKRCNLYQNLRTQRTCDIVQAVQVLLQEVNPLLEGLPHPTLGCVHNFDVVSGEFIQILHTGGDQ